MSATQRMLESMKTGAKFELFGDTKPKQDDKPAPHSHPLKSVEVKPDPDKSVAANVDQVIVEYARLGELLFKLSYLNDAETRTFMKDMMACNAQAQYLITTKGTSLPRVNDVLVSMANLHKDFSTWQVFRIQELLSLTAKLTQRFNEFEEQSATGRANIAKRVEDLEKAVTDPKGNKDTK